MGYFIAAIVALFAFSRSSLSSLTGTSGVFNSPPVGQVLPTTATSSQAFGVASVASNVASKVPVIGQAASAILSTLISVFAQASKKRAQEATSENTAVAAAVPAWDKNVATIANYYNTGQISASGVATALDAIWANYWSEVSPQIQPGRNGCQSGQVTQPAGVSFCGGSYGAACCVGYDDLKNSNVNMKYAVSQADNTGKPTPAAILEVFASKYGGINRPAYTVTFIRPS